MLTRRLLALALPFLVLAEPASGSTLGVSPVVLEVPAPDMTSKIMLRNKGEETVAAQIRVFRWVQRNGQDELIPTKDVVASPPAAKLLPNKDYKVRLVRLAKNPIEGEESYRLLIDQLPKSSSSEGFRIAFTLRHSIPVFFQSGEIKTGQLRWSVSIKEGKLVVTASNPGSRRVRLMDVRLGSGSEIIAPESSGMAGYVLGGSAAQWRFPLPPSVKAGSKITITAQDERGPVKVTAKVGGAS
jgi:fimbrial chaperone protein